MKPFLVSSSIATSVIVGAIAVTLVGFSSVQANTQQVLSQRSTNWDNIYHEDENLPDNADVFPRMGKIEGRSSERTNCRATPGGRVVRTFTGGSFMEINNRVVDRKRESWFRTADSGCWIHDSRIDLL